MKSGASEFVKGFVKKLSSHPDFEAGDFRVVADYSESVSIGQKENELLGPYDMPALSKSLTASLYIIWKDGKVSNANLNYENMQNFECEIAGWRKNAFRDEFAPAIWREEGFSGDDLKKYKNYDAEVEAMTKGEADPLFSGIDFINRELGSIAKLITVNAAASLTRRFIYLGGASEEPAYDFSFTTCGISFDLDNVFGDSFVKRRAFKEKDLKAITDNAKFFYPAFSKKIDKSEVFSKSSQMPVVLTPPVADSFIKKYLMSNLYGKLVVEKQSRFDISDFRSGEKVTRDDISVIFTQSDEDFEINNIPLTFEGVPAAPAHFIKNGRLVSPMLDLKYAKKAEMAPNAYLTPEMFQSSYYSVKVETGEYEAARAVISDLSDGFIIFGVLGMHTQDQTSGDFSISSPYAVRVVDGKPEGLAKISLAGNFFEQLNHHNTKFLNWYQEGDCFLMRCQCS